MTDKQKSEVLETAEALETLAMGGVADLVRRLHAENETLRTGYDAARLEIESLKAQLHAAKQINTAQFWLLTSSIPGSALRVSHWQAPAQVAPSVGTIGHIGDGPTTLTAAVAPLLAAQAAPEALRLADRLSSNTGHVGGPTMDAAAAELRRLHAENTTLQTGYAAARLEIESLQRRVQEVGAVARREHGLAAAPTAQPAPQQEPSHTAVQLAELVLSDCGHSSNYTPLLDRVAARIDSHVERCLESKKTPQQEEPADELEEVLRERDDAEDFINELLDEVLGVDRPEWSNAYNRYDAMNDVRERITALHKPAVDKAWGLFEPAMAAPQPSPAAQAFADLETLSDHAFNGQASAPPHFGDEAHVAIPQMLLGAACSAIDKKRDGTKVLAELRRYTTGDLSQAIAPAPAAQGDALDAARLDWLENDVGCRVVHLGKSWYTRANFGMPYHKRASLREAIDAARKEMS